MTCHPQQWVICHYDYLFTGVMVFWGIQVEYCCYVAVSFLHALCEKVEDELSRIKI